MEDEDRKYLYALNTAWHRANGLCIDTGDPKPCRLRELLDKEILKIEKLVESRRTT